MIIYDPSLYGASNTVPTESIRRGARFTISPRLLHRTIACCSPAFHYRCAVSTANPDMGERIMKTWTKGTCVAALLLCGGTCSIAAAESGTYESVASLVTSYAKAEHGDETIIGGSSSGTSTVTRS